MKRREFVGSAIAAVTTAGGGAAPFKRKRSVERWCNGEWRPCRLSEVRAFDVIRLEQVGILRTTRPAWRGDDGAMWVAADYMIDEPTNQWVPVAA